MTEKITDPEQQTHLTVDDLIKMVAGFTPTVDDITPCLAFELDDSLAGELLDVAGVFAGVKPAAMIALGWGGQTDLLLSAFRERAVVDGITVLETPNNSGTSLVFSRDPEVAARIKSLMTDFLVQNKADEQYDTEIGTLLGYPKEAVKRYVQNKIDRGDYDLVRWYQTPAGQDFLRRYVNKKEGV